MKKKLIAVICVVAVVLIAVAVFLIVGLGRMGDGTPPELSAVKDRFVALIEASPAANEILFGAGLDTYPRITENRIPYEIGRDQLPSSIPVPEDEESFTLYYYTFEDGDKSIVAYQYYIHVKEKESNNYTFYNVQTGELLGVLNTKEYYRYAEKSREVREGYLTYNEETGYYYYPLPDYKEPEFFYTADDDPYYDYCTPDCGYENIEGVKKFLGQVYSAAYLAPLYENLFTGVAFAEGESGVLYARYRDYVEEGYTYLQQCNLIKGYTLADRHYDYDTMKILKKSENSGQRSNAKYVIVEIESYIVGKEDERTAVELTFAKENGEWFLDSPTY